MVIRPEVESDMADAVNWYNERQAGLGQRFIEEVFAVWDSLSENPRLGSRRHPTKDIRWRFPPHFPFRIIYQIEDETHEVVVLAVLHAARHAFGWTDRIKD